MNCSLKYWAECPFVSLFWEEKSFDHERSKAIRSAATFSRSMLYVLRSDGGACFLSARCYHSRRSAKFSKVVEGKSRISYSSLQNSSQLPTDIESILQTDIHTLTRFWRVGMACIASQEYTVIF